MFSAPVIVMVDPPVRDVPGEIPKSPFSVLAPVAVTAVPAKTTKLSAVPSETGSTAPEAVPAPHRSNMAAVPTAVVAKNALRVNVDDVRTVWSNIEYSPQGNLRMRLTGG